MAEAQASSHPIAERWRSMGGAGGWLGEPVMGIACGLEQGGCFQSFERGGLYWTEGTGTKFVRGEIRNGWARLGWETGNLGYPTSDEFCGLRGGGCAQRFEGGHLYWTPGTGAHATWGKINDRYGSMSWERGSLGYPTGPEFCGLRDGGCAQRFQSGMMYWSFGSGANPMVGKLLEHYAGQGWETGHLGYPTSGEMNIRGGVRQDFQGGRRDFDFASGRVSDPDARPRHVEHCEASNYWQGQQTANGERFDPNAMTAAHKTLPFDSIVRVTNRANGKSVEVRINDRGPYISGRCIDLSRGSFSKIADPSAGVADVTVELL